MRLEDTHLLHGDGGIEVVLDPVFHEVGEELALTVRERDELEPAAQTPKAGEGVGERRQLVPALHDACDVGVAKRQLAGAQRIDESPARRIEIPVVTGIELIVLVLLDALAVAPPRPEIFRGDLGAAGLQKRAQTRGVTSTQVENRAEDIERQRVDDSQRVHGLTCPWSSALRAVPKTLTTLRGPWTQGLEHTHAVALGVGERDVFPDARDIHRLAEDRG